MLIAVILVLIICVLLLSLSSYHQSVILSHLKRYGCDPTLYNLVRNAKQNTSGFCEQVRVETSTKNGKGGRYIIPILLTEYQRYQRQDQLRILKHLGFTPQKLMKFLDDKNISDNTDIIFGVDQNQGSGKIYLDYGHEDIALKCLETTGKVKLYKNKGNGKLAVNIVGSKLPIDGYHHRLDKPYRNRHGDYIYWVAELKDGSKTDYTRPYLLLIDVVDFLNYMVNLTDI